MILYVNGCSHTAAAEAAVDEAFAVDDGQNGIDRRPHPANLAVSWCTKLAQHLGIEMYCDAESASSNDRMIRTTRDWIKNNPDKLSNTFMIIQWSTWEREEWLHNGIWYQVNASGWDIVPPELRDRYKQYVIDVDWKVATRRAHDQIWAFHQELTHLQIPHLFFNGHSTFSELPADQDWGVSYIQPYSIDHSYSAVCRNNGFEYVNPKTYHFGADAHCFWANYVLQYINDNNLIAPNEISAD